MLDVPDAMSRASTSPTRSPRVAASRAMPAPVTPPPITRTSSSSSAIARTSRFGRPAGKEIRSGSMAIWTGTRKRSSDLRTPVARRAKWSDLDVRAVDTGRLLAVDAVQKVGNGHPGTAMSLSPADMDFVGLKAAAAREIALAFGVPPMLLGIPGDNTYSNYQEAQRAFYRLTVLPLVRRTVEALSGWLAPLYPGRMRIGIDLDRVEGLAAERDALWARLEAASFLTDTEKREAVGYAPTPTRNG